MVICTLPHVFESVVTDVSFSCRNKAIADGAVSFYIDHCVDVRIATTTYGIECLTSFDENDPEHITRSNKAIFRPPGRIVLPDYFDVILKKVGAAGKILNSLILNNVRKSY